MLHDQDIYGYLWEKSTSTTMYVQDISLNTILNEKTPKEVFTGEKPKISHLQIFGCPMYIHIPNEKRTNMEPFGKKGNFVGYNDTSKEFRIYVLGERHVELVKK